MSQIICNQGGQVVALFDNSSVPSVLPGVLVYKGLNGFIYWSNRRASSVKIAGLVAIGGCRGRDRLEIQQLFRAHNLELPVLKHESAVVSSCASIGPGCQLLALANVSVNVQIGEACIINHRASVDHDCCLGDGVHLAPGATLCGCVNVADNVLIGAGAVILPGISIGADAVIGAGAVVTRNIPSGVTVVGNPAMPV